MRPSRHEKYYNRRSKIRGIVSENNKNLKNFVHSSNNDILPSIIDYKCNVKFSSSDYKISQEDVGRRGIIITKPGIYEFCSDIIFNPCKHKEFTCAIIIASSNVTLNLGQYSLSQKNKNKNTYGIVVTRDVNNIVITGIKNRATINNFTLAGIRVYGRTKYISINNVIVRQDIPVQLTNEEIPADCKDILDFSLNLGIAIGEGDTFGVHMKETNKANLVKEFSLVDVVAEGSVIGCHIIFTFGFEILRSVFTKNTYNGLLVGTGWAVPGDGPFGLEFPVGGNGVITDCRFEKNYGLNFGLVNPSETFIFDFLSAIALYEVSNVKVDRCLVADNSNNGYIIAADHDASQNITWTNSVVTKTRSISGPADGLHFSGSIPSNIGLCTFGVDYPLIQDFNITIKNCTSTDGVSREGRSAGFVIAFVQGAHISDCNASGMVGGTESSGFDIVGDLPGGRTSNITLINNTAERNGENGKGISAGFKVDNVIDNIILKNNIANGNGTGKDLDFGSGFLVISISENDSEPYIRNIDFDNCTANNNGNGKENSGGFVALNLTETQIPVENVAIQKSVAKFNNGYGVLFNGNVVGGSINEMELYQNTLGGINIANNTNQVFVSRNTAYLNGIYNYQGISESAIITGTVNDLPSNPGFKNVSIN